MSDDIFSTMDQASAATSAPAPGPMAPPPAPSNVVSIFDQMDVAQHAMNATQPLDDGTTPDTAAKSLQISRTSGVPYPAVTTNLASAQAQQQANENRSILFQNPKLQQYIAANPMAARIAQDDFNHLDMLSKIIASISSGAREGLEQNQMGRLGNIKQAAALAGIPTPATDAQIDDLQRRLAATPQLHSGYAAVQGLSGFVAGLVDNAISALPEAAGGAAIGAAAGGAGAVPGAIAGFGVGLPLDMARVSAGNTYLRLSQTVGEDGQPVSELGKQFGALFSGAAAYALGKYQAAAEMKLFGQDAQSLAEQAAIEAATRPSYAQAFAKLAVGGISGATRGALTMGGLEASNIVAEQIAKAVSPGKFTTDPNEIVERLADALVEGAATFGAMGVLHSSLGLYGDLASARRAEQQAAMFQNLEKGATESKLHSRDLQSFQEFMQSQLQGEPADHVYIPASKVLEMYQGARIDPNVARENDPLFGFVKDMPEQLREAQATNGEVVIPTADYVAHLAGTPISQQLMADLRVGANSMSVNEAKELDKQYEAQAPDALAAAAKSGPEPHDAIAEDMRQRAVAAGRPNTEAASYAQIAASRVVTRAERLGVDPMKLYQQEPIEVQRGTEAEATAAPEQGEFRQEGARGKIRFQDGRKIISLFKDADHSTLIHEGGHAWLAELMEDAQREDAPQSLQDDAKSTLKWLGVDAPGKIGTEQHEQFARAAEAYLMEGKAPSRALGSVFARFGRWLKRIYQTVSRLNVPINDEIRGVFDRLLATDEEIADARRQQGLEPAFRTKEEAGMTSAEWGAYLKKIESSKIEAESTLLEKTMARLRRSRTAEYQEEEAPVREAATQQVDSTPDMKAWNAVTRGVMPDGTEGEKLKIDRTVAQKTYGKDVANLPRGTLAEGGMHPDDAAELTGHASGDAFMKGLMSLEQRQREIRATEGERRGVRQYLIDTEVGNRMADRDIMDEASIRDEAIASINGEQSQELQAMELRYLNRKGTQALIERGKGRKAVQQAMAQADWDAAEQELITALDKAKTMSQIERLQAALESVRDQQKIAKREAASQGSAMKRALEMSRPMLEALRANADHLIDGKTTEELQRSQFKWSRDERKAAGEVQEAIRKGDWTGAGAAKQRQILSGILFSRAREAQRFVESGMKRLQKIADSATLSGVDQEYVDQMHMLLARFGMQMGRDMAELQRGVGSKTLRDFFMEKYADGIELPLTQELAWGSGTVDAMKLPQFRDLMDMVDSMRRAGRAEQEVTIGGKVFEKRALVQRMVDSLGRLSQREKGEFLYPEDAGVIKAKALSVASALRSMDASLLKKEQIFDWADLGDQEGPFNQAVFRPLKAAAFDEMRMRTEAVKAWRDMQKAMPKKWAKTLRDIISSDLIDPDTGAPMKINRQRLIAMALNWGTEDNATKLAAGYGWDRAEIQRLLDQNMAKEDWKFVRGTWEIFDRYRQPVDDLQRRVSGVGIEFVPGRPVSTKFGMIDGGYFPLFYDATKSVTAQRNLERTRAGLFEKQFHRVTTRNGSVISRVEGVRQPIDLNLDNIPWKINQTIHDLAFREPLMQADRILSDRRVIQALDNSFGPEIRKTMRPWLQHIANVDNVPDSALGWLENLFNAARSNVVMVGIGFRASTAVKHGFSALAQSFTELGPRWMLRGVREAFGTPEQMRRSWQWAIDTSQELKYRRQQYDRDLHSNLDEWINKGTLHKVNARLQEYGHLLVSYLDFGSAVPTFIGAYRKAVEQDGLSHEDAVYYGEKVVRNAHGAQSIVDRAAFQDSKNPIARMTGMFYGFLNHMYNRLRQTGRIGAQGVTNIRAGRYGQGIRDFTQVAARTAGYLIVPGIVNAMVRSGGPNQDKDEGWWEWGAKAIAGEAAGTIPIVRDVADAALNDYEYEPTPLSRMVKTAITTWHDAEAELGIRDKNPSKRELQNALETAGYFTGTPTGQLGAALQLLWDYNDGKVDPQTLNDWWRGITTGHVPKD